MKNTKLSYFSYFCILFLSLPSGCEKYKNHPIPEVYLNFSINILYDPEFIRLQAQNNSMVITNNTLGILSLGYNNNGILVYNAGGEFYAFDRTCPYDYPESIIVESDGTSGIATCPVCGSVYVLPSRGAPSLEGPATFPLKEYNAFYNPNTGNVNVYN
ncbi:MAG: hypothetical protein PVF73_07730 [Bacteroidales bacterium]|jgi:nitrite reductase/ring-hydroxylating ferredoxin subunit